MVSPQPNQTTETELTLIIRAEDPDGTVEWLAGLRSLAGFRLEPRPTLDFLDVYFLSHQEGPRFALRIRDFGNRVLIALKGPARKTPWGALQRVEVETPWTEEGIKRIADELRRFGPGASINVPDISHVTAEDLFRSWGFSAVQRRTTRRQVRDVVKPVTSAQTHPVAEMVVDSVCYYFSGSEVRHFELELEEKQPESGEHIQRMAEELIARSDARLETWDHDKLMLGMAIEALSKKGELHGLLGRGNALKPSAYGKILAAIRTGSAVPSSVRG